MIDAILSANPDLAFIKLDGYDDCILGFNDREMKLIYSKNKIIDKLIEDMPREDAMEFYDFNIYNLCIAGNMPILCDDDYYGE